MSGDVDAADPQTEGELYDRLIALREECDLLTRSVDHATAMLLQAAAAQIEAARKRWLAAWSGDVDAAAAGGKGELTVTPYWHAGDAPAPADDATEAVIETPTFDWSGTIQEEEDYP